MRLLLFLGFLALSITASAQGNVDGFFKPKGDLDVAFSGGYAHADQYIGGSNLINYKRSQTILSVYAAYGLSQKWNVIASLPLINFSLQDVALFTKYKLVEKVVSHGAFTLAPAAGISFPVTSYNTESGQSIGQRAVTIQPKFVAQYINVSNVFIQVQTGYNYSLNPVPSAYVASAKLGYIYKKWYFDFWYDYQYGIGGKDYASFNIDPLNSFRELGVSYSRIGGVIYSSLGKKWGAFIGASHALTGRNTSLSTSINGGVVIKFDTNKK